MAIADDSTLESRLNMLRIGHGCSFALWGQDLVTLPYVHQYMPTILMVRDRLIRTASSCTPILSTS
jgi:hypothetical protein